jgi:hypothetical protein
MMENRLCSCRSRPRVKRVVFRLDLRVTPWRLTLCLSPKVVKQDSQMADESHPEWELPFCLGERIARRRKDCIVADLDLS